MNSYQIEGDLRARIALKGARSVIGGLWDELGELQVSFLRSRGLRADHRVLDVGCGCLRAGVKLVPLLQPDHYFGLDISPALLEAGRAELKALGLLDRVARRNLRATASFDASGFPRFDFGIAQSVFTHLPLPAFVACLYAIKPNFVCGGRFFATFFAAPEGSESYRQLCGKHTYSARDPFHVTPAAVLQAASEAGWRGSWIGDWSHPKDQQIAEFVVS